MQSVLMDWRDVSAVHQTKKKGGGGGGQREGRKEENKENKRIFASHSQRESHRPTIGFTFESHVCCFIIDCVHIQCGFYLLPMPVCE